MTNTLLFWMVSAPTWQLIVAMIVALVVGMVLLNSMRPSKRRIYRDL